MTDPSLEHLLRRLGLVEDRIRALVLHRRADDPAPDDPFRGLYLTDEVVSQLLSPGCATPAVDWAARQSVDNDADIAHHSADDGVNDGVDHSADDGVAHGADHGVDHRTADTTADIVAGPEGPRSPARLRSLTVSAGLSDLDVEILLIALIPDLDSRFERLYGYLNDDVTRRRATIGLALDLADVPSASADARSRLLPGSPLIDRALIGVEDTDRPFLTRALRVPDRVTAHLLGDDAPDPALVGLVTQPAKFAGAQSLRLAGALRAGQRLTYFREAGEGIGPSVAAAAMAELGRPVLGIDLLRVAAGRDPREAIAILGREAVLRDAGVVAGPVEALTQERAVTPDGAGNGGAEALRLLAGLPLPVTIVGSVTWDPNWTDQVPLLITAPTLTPAERMVLWADALRPAQGSGLAEVDHAIIPAHFVLGPRQVDRAVRAATAAALLGNGGLTADDLRRGARAQNAAGLERLARRIEPAVGWDDIVLPGSSRGQLLDLASRARHRDRVLVEWQMRKGGGRGRGVTALFAGDSGTGKTMAAEVIAGELGLDLYTVNLATVVDKYVGETEKNLERIFSEAGGVNAVLLFDEADAIFGKRSEVRDAHDRYANIESAYLLQRMETFDGLAVLATNLRSNIDEAFTRRLDMIIDFPAPDDASRLAIWRQCLRSPAPCEPDLDLEFCARAFTLSGGNIRSAATTAGYLAAGRDGAIGMAELISAVQQEYRKLGRLVLEREFGPYFSKPVSNGARR